MRERNSASRGGTAYFENLDALRFLSFLSVFFFHSFHTTFSELRETRTYQFIKFDVFGNGNLGVNFFFVLSGFLITYLLLSEKSNWGQISLKNFWLRRVLRIWPLFYACVFFGFVIFPALKAWFGEVPNETAHPLYYLTFLNNFDFIAKGPPDASVLGVLWSIAVEEQFYFIWPLILFLVPIRHLWIPFLLLLIASLTFRAYHDSGTLNEYHTISCIGDMVIGSMGAWLIHSSEGFKESVVQMKRVFILTGYLLFFAVYFYREELFMWDPYLRFMERSIIAMIIIFIILEQNYCRNSFFKVGRLKLMSKLGVISYGLYCTHFIGILISTNFTSLIGFNTELWQVMILETILALGLTIAISWLSYRYYERPFLLLKGKFERPSNITGR